MGLAWITTITSGAKVRVVCSIHWLKDRKAFMSSKRTKIEGSLNLTREESESMGVAFPEEPFPVPADIRELPLHEQIVGDLTEDEVTEALTGEVTPESREDVEDLFADLQEEEADRQAD